MAEMIGSGYYLSVAGTNLSLWVEELTINRDRALEEFVTSNGVAGQPLYKRRIAGTVDLKVSVKFSDDFATDGPHQTLAALAGTSFEVIAAIDGPTPSDENEVLTDTMTFGGLSAGGAAGARLTKSIDFVHASGVPVFATS
jgi:hypothetical protein